MKKLLLLVMAVSFAGVAGASVWERPTVDGPGNWKDAANWDVANGVPIAATGNSNLGANAANLAEAQVTDAQTFGGRLRVGTGIAGAAGGVIRIMDGGSLSSGDGATRSYIGDQYDGKMIIEEGGTFTHMHRLYLGESAGVTGIVDVYGTLNMTANNIYLGGKDGVGIGKLNVRGNGVANFRAFSTDRLETGPGSTLDISSNGRAVVAGNETGNAEARIAAGDITGYGVVGNVILTNEGGETTITAGDDPLDRLPEYEDYVGTGDVDLSWINLDSYPSGGDVWIDVWFGTDMTWVMPTDANLPGDYADFVKYVDAELGTIDDGVTVPAPDDGKDYIWRVDTYRDGDPATATPGHYEDIVIAGNPLHPDPNFWDDEIIPALYEVDEGLLMRFTALDDMPPSVVIDTEFTAVAKNVPIQLDITVTDDGESTVTFLWESNDPNAVFRDPGTGLEDNTIENPTVEVNYASRRFNVTVTVSDGTNPDADSDSVGLYVAEDECDASRSGMDLDIPGDIDEDCSVGLSDIAMLAAKWADEYAATVPFLTP